MVQDFSNTQSLLPCKRCGELLQESDRFCRYCGHDQNEPEVDALLDLEPVRTPAGAGRPLAPLAPESRRSHGRAAAGARALLADVETKPDLAFPGAVWQRQADRPPVDDAPPDWSTRSISPSRLALGISAALLLALALVLVHDLYVEWKGEAVAKESLKENVEQVQGVIQETDQKIQELTQERERLRSAGSTSTATTASDPTPAPAPPEQPAPPAPPAPPMQVERAAAPPAPAPPEAPAAAAPAAPAAPAAQPSRTECSEALAALSLCPSQ